MSSSLPEVERIVNAIAAAGDITAKKMFGEYGIYCDGKMVAMVCDDRLFVKRTQAGYDFWGEHEEDLPYPGAKPCMVLSDSDFRDRLKLVDLIRITQRELPEAKPKKPRPSSR